MFVFHADDELNNIARRYGFEPVFPRSINSNANGRMGIRSFHSDFRRNSHVSHQTFCYLCSINQHEHEPTKPRDESKVMASCQHCYYFVSFKLIYFFSFRDANYFHTTILKFDCLHRHSIDLEAIFHRRI